jgi:hypothetical protein
MLAQGTKGIDQIGDIVLGQPQLFFVPQQHFFVLQYKWNR